MRKTTAPVNVCHMSITIKSVVTCKKSHPNFISSDAEETETDLSAGVAVAVVMGCVSNGKTPSSRSDVFAVRLVHQTVCNRCDKRSRKVTACWCDSLVY